MNNKTDIEEDIKILENKTSEFRYVQNTLDEDEKESYADDIQETEVQAIENILTEYREKESKANKYDSLVEKIKEKIEEIRNYEDIAREQIQARIIVADSDSLNFGRKQAHGKDISILQELLDTEKPF